MLRVGPEAPPLPALARDSRRGAAETVGRLFGLPDRQPASGIESVSPFYSSWWVGISANAIHASAIWMSASRLRRTLTLLIPILHQSELTIRGRTAPPMARSKSSRKAATPPGPPRHFARSAISTGSATASRRRWRGPRMSGKPQRPSAMVGSTLRAASAVVFTAFISRRTEPRWKRWRSTTRSARRRHWRRPKAIAERHFAQQHSK